MRATLSMPWANLQKGVAINTWRSSWKFAHGIESVARIPYYVEMATRHAIYGRPGASYLDMPDDIITGKCDLDKVIQVQRVPEPPRMVAPMENIEAALNLLEKAERPLVLVGKGMAWSRAEDEV